MLFVPIAIFDVFALSFFHVFTVFAVAIALPFHLVSVGTFASGLYAISKAEGRPTLVFLRALPAITGFLVCFALIFVRFKYVPLSEGLFIKGFAASGAPLRLPGKPLDPHGQKDVHERPGEMYEIRHKPVAVIGDDSLWLVRRDHRSAAYWIERRAIAPGGSNWRHPPSAAYPSALTPGPGSSIFVVGFGGVAANASWWLKRYDAKGAEDMSWNKSFPVTNYVCLIYGLRLDRDGSVYVFGETGEIDRRGTFGWVRKFHPDGREQIAGWDKRFPNAGKRQPAMAVVGMAVDSAGSPCVLLRLYNSAYFLRKFDRDGRELWQRELPSLKDMSISGNDKGNLLICGMSDSPPFQAQIIKLRPDGGDVWEKKFTLGDQSAACAAVFDRAQNIYVAGFGTSPRSKASHLDSYWWIKKFDLDGAELTGWCLGENGVNVPFALYVNSRDELYVLGTGNGWQFSDSRLERWWNGE
jgi:hypothetical protein